MAFTLARHADPRPLDRLWDWLRRRAKPISWLKRNLIAMGGEDHYAGLRRTLKAKPEQIVALKKKFDK
jgi:hypothetical protein